MNVQKNTVQFDKRLDMDWRLFSVKQLIDQHPTYHPLTSRCAICTDAQSKIEIFLHIWELQVYVDEMRARGNGGVLSVSLDRRTNAACGCCGNICLNIAQGSSFLHTKHTYGPQPLAFSLSPSLSHMRLYFSVHQWFEKWQEIHNEESLNHTANKHFLSFPLIWELDIHQHKAVSEFNFFPNYKCKNKKVLQLIKTLRDISGCYAHISSQVTRIHAETLLVN